MFFENSPPPQTKVHTKVSTVYLYVVMVILCLLTGASNGPSSDSGASETRLKAYEEMNNFLSSFIERVRG